MSNIFLISDTHFMHQNMYKFTNYDGTKVRPWETAEEGDEFMIENWNATVKPQDKVYHLGDVAMQHKGIAILDKLNGTKVLIRGNHDIFKLKDYAPFFKDIRGSHKLDRYVLTHMPIHPDAVAHWCEGNIHGHLHNNLVGDCRYLNVSVERINYTPIAFEDIETLRRE